MDNGQMIRGDEMMSKQAASVEAQVTSHVCLDVIFCGKSSVFEPYLPASYQILHIYVSDHGSTVNVNRRNHPSRLVLVNFVCLLDFDRLTQRSASSSKNASPLH